MRAGKLRHRIVIQRRTSTVDDYGGQVEAWQNVATVWSAVEPLSGRDLIAAQAANSETTVKFIIRYLAGIDQSMRIVYGGKNYNITAVINVDERNRELQIMAATGLNEG